VMDRKAVFAATTTINVFEFLARHGVRVAYRAQVSDTAFVAQLCEMIPLEVIARRYPVGSYLKRHPELVKPEGVEPHCFDEPLIELFLKTSGGSLDFRGRSIVQGLDPKAGHEDPFMVANIHCVGSWLLYHSKKPVGESGFLGKHVQESAIGLDLEKILIIKKITKTVFLLLEQAWKRLDCKLIDFKLEFGFNSKGEIVLADVIDADSWRLRDKEWKDLSKQSFRDGEALGEVSRKYALVADMTQKFAQMRIDI